MRERITQGHDSVEFAAVIIRLIGYLIFKVEGGRFIHHGGGWCQRVRAALQRFREGGRVDERFETRSRLALTKRVVELTDSIVASTNQSLEFTSLGIETDERHLRERVLLVSAVFFISAF